MSHLTVVKTFRNDYHQKICRVRFSNQRPTWIAGIHPTHNARRSGRKSHNPLNDTLRKKPKGLENIVEKAEKKCL